MLLRAITFLLIDEVTTLSRSSLVTTTVAITITIVIILEILIIIIVVYKEALRLCFLRVLL